MIRLIALLILGTALASCASGTHKIVDMIPEWAGGLPKGVPPRPGTPEYEVYRKGVDEPAKGDAQPQDAKNPTPHNRPPQSAASSFIGGRSAQGSAGASERRTGLPVTFRQLPEVKVRASGDASTLDRGGIPAYPSSPR
jgi:hypothetical protein